MLQISGPSHQWRHRSGGIAIKGGKLQFKGDWAALAAV
jgi:hypothetical protein